MKYRGLELDKFQEEAISHIDEDKSVIVSAGTGTGKTLIADYLIEKSINEGSRVIYTSPIKALSNQKFKDFKALYGDKIGLLTGDVSINEDAQILIMTTEIYRNMLLSKDPICDTISYVIFDEIHYINDIERGTIWEESIIFASSNTKMLALSATIPNANELRDWISSLRPEEVALVYYEDRAVPLNHMFFEHFNGLMEREEMPKKIKELKSYARHSPGKKGKKKKPRLHSPEIARNQFLDLVHELKQKEWMPCIFFSFSRKTCEMKADKVAKKMNLLSKEERTRVAEIIPKYITAEASHLKSVKLVRNALMKGAGVHHAGILPAVKELVEHLFSEGLVKVLFATETFAVGINMPAKAVCFSSMEKFDGISFRHLTTKEYFQMAGRAGRRGIDNVGYSIVLLEPDFADTKKLMYITEKDRDPIRSQYTLSYNTTVNLLKYQDEKTIEKILKSNFGYFVKKRQENQVRIMSSYKNQLKRLRKLGCIDNQNNILEKGEFMSHIYSDEVLMTELVYSGVLDELSAEEISIVIASVAYDGKKSDHFSFRGVDKEYSRLIKLLSKDKVIEKNINKLSVKRMINVVMKWSEGCDFLELMEYSNLAEGDHIRLFRQIIDRIQQLIKAGVSVELEEKLVKAMNLLDRDVVKVEF
ncbi:MAG: DEAD/DEAH box helicase [Nanobdellota archaeon]